MQNGKVLDANLIQAGSLDKISTLNGIALITDPDTSIPGGLYEESSLFSIGFQQPVIGSASYRLLETVLTRAHEGMLVKFSLPISGNCALFVVLVLTLLGCLPNFAQMHMNRGS